MSRDELEAWLRLLNLEFSPAKVRALLQRFGTIEGIWCAKPSEWREVHGIREAEVLALERAAQAPAEIPPPLADGSMQLLLESDPRYPAPLRELPDMPVALFVWGELQERDRFAVSIVGTRHPTSYGTMVAERLARDLSEAGLTIVSGGAIGIDSAAHRATLEAGGRTIAILGSGLGRLYPAGNRHLFQRIAQQGAVVSQYPYDAEPDAWRFPVRNQLIAGWGLGTIVVEAPEESGALITARLAAEYGREVFAVPGTIDNPKAKGCHALIKDGAMLIDSAQDVLDTLGVQTLPRERPATLPMLTEAQERLLNALTLQPQHLDTLARAVQLPVQQVQVELTMLEMMGLARRMPGGAFVRVL
ncbi:MAG: DNA-processing protein DprA [Armatimonadota bacterium]